MVTLKKYDITGKEIGTVEVNDVHLEVKSHPQSIKDYIVAIRNNARQWSAHTKTRCEIQRTGRKPHPQKGGGRSRQGDLAAPQYKGGGIVFGPRKKDWIHTRINQKERRAAIRFILAEKVREGHVHILAKADLESPKTKTVANFFDKLGVKNSRILVLAEGKGEMGKAHENFVKSLRNIPKKEYGMVPQINGYTLAKSKDLVVLDSALDEFLSVLGVS